MSSRPEKVIWRRVHTSFVAGLVIPPFAAVCILYVVALVTSGPEVADVFEAIGGWIWDGVAAVDGEAPDRVLQIVLMGLTVAAGLFVAHSVTRASDPTLAELVYGQWARGTIVGLYMALGCVCWILVAVNGLAPSGAWWASLASIVVAMVAAVFVAAVGSDQATLVRRQAELRRQIERLENAADEIESHVPGTPAGWQFAGFRPGASAVALTGATNVALATLLGADLRTTAGLFMISSLVVGAAAVTLIMGRSDGHIAQIQHRRSGPRRAQELPAYALVLCAGLISVFVELYALGWVGLAVLFMQGSGVVRYVRRGSPSDRPVMQRSRRRALAVLNRIDERVSEMGQAHERQAVPARSQSARAGDADRGARPFRSPTCTRGSTASLRSRSADIRDARRGR